MNKIIAILAFALTLSSASAQSGLHIGANYQPQGTWLLGNNVDNGEFTFGNAFGANVEFHFSDVFGIGTGFLYSQEGQKYTPEGVEHTTEINYIKVPFLLHLNSDANSGVIFMVDLGFQYALVSSAKISGDFDLQDENGNEIDSDDIFNKSNIGVVAAAGPGFRLGDNFMLTIKLRWDLQLKDIIDAGYNVLYTDEYEGSMPMTFGLNFGLKFMIGGG